MYYHKYVNTETGEETITELSKEEIAVIEANIVRVAAEQKVLAEKAQAKAAIADRLGLTADELALLLG